MSIEKTYKAEHFWRKEIYRSIFENTGTATIIIDESTIISLANKEFEALSGFSKQEIEGRKSWTDFVAFDSELIKMQQYHYQRKINPDSAPKRYEAHFKDKKGAVRNVFISVDVIPGTGKIVASFLDMTELKQTQEALEKSEEKYRLLAENSSDIIWSTDADLRFTYISPSVEKILGYSQEEAFSLSFGQSVTPATYRMVKEKYLDLKAGKIKQTLTLELEQISKKGAVIQTEVSVTPVFDRNGKLAGIYGVTRDISRRREIEKRLQVLNFAVESSLSGFVLSDLNGYITYMNHSCLRSLKYEREQEVLGRHFTQFLSEKEDGASILDTLHRHEKWGGEVTARKKDGNPIYIYMLASMVRDKNHSPMCLMSSFVDITARKNAEKDLQDAYEKLEHRVEVRTRELKKSESRLKRSQQVAKAATWERDFMTGEIYWSDEQFRLFGYEPAELTGKEIFRKHVQTSERERIKEHFYSCLRERKEIEFRFPYTVKTGENRFARIHGHVELDKAGNPLHIYGVMQDITDRVETEKALQQSQENYEKLLLSTRQVASYKNIIGKSKEMRQIYALVQQLANVDTTVLVTGDSGTGKELIVEAIHAAGHRAEGPLIKVNCSALSENLLESELFGHVRGAFTGATHKKKGRIELAEGGTLFLDEIGEISPNTQVKLLRFLDEKKYERVGDVKTLDADVRIVTATNADLLKKVKAGLFREDLYYRLRVMPIHLPPLRERTEDIPLLVQHFCRGFSRTFNKKISGASNEVLRLFMEYQWPGNVRELEHALEHGALLCPGGEICLEHLPKDLLFHSDHSSPGKHCGRTRIDRQALVQALKAADGNKSAAARKLGISRRTIYRKLQAFGMLSE